MCSRRHPHHVGGLGGCGHYAEPLRRLALGGQLPVMAEDYRR